jgi:hypothetical protein
MALIRDLVKAETLTKLYSLKRRLETRKKAKKK